MRTTRIALFESMVLLLAIMQCQCNSGGENQIGELGCKTTRENAERYKSMFNEICPEKNGIDSYQEKDIMKIVCDAVLQGQQDAIAVLVSEVDESSPLWQVELANEYARMWANRDFPIYIGASPTTMKALERLAGLNYANAAIAIIDKNPELAEKVLRSEYADFEIYNYFNSRPEISRAKYLGRLGVWLPEEIVSTDQAIEILCERHKDEYVNDPDFILTAANAFNSMIRKAAIEDDQAVLEKLKYDDGRSQKLYELYLDAKSGKLLPPEPTAIFVSGEEGVGGNNSIRTESQPASQAASQSATQPTAKPKNENGGGERK